MRSRFDEQLSQLNRELIELGAQCEEAIALAAKAFLDADTVLADRVTGLLGEIDRSERQIEALCLRLLLQQQPVARDLRQVSAALKMITDLERIGHQAADVAEIARYLPGRQDMEGIPLGDMAREAIGMVTGSVDAYVRQDTRLAAEVVERDDVVDGLFLQVRRSLTAMIAARPGQGEYALDLLMVAKYLERIGDHAVNLAQWVIFAVTGEHGREEKP